MKVLFDFVLKECSFGGQTIDDMEHSLELFNNSATCSSKDIIDAYIAYGNECFKHLQGSFSFALYDKKRQQLMVVRDKLGTRQMYYSQLPTGIVFSTDLQEILPYIKHPTIRPHELAQPIRHNYPIEPQHTWINQILRLCDGEYAVVDKDGLQIHTYFRRDYTPIFSGSKDQAIKQSLDLLRQSTRKCIENAPGPVAVLLSGGLDSTSIAAFTKEIQGEVHVFSAGYRGNKSVYMDERDVAKRFADDMGLIYHEVELDVNDFREYLDELMPILDEPCFDVNCMVQYALFKKIASMGFKTVLHGEGGDDCFYASKESIRLVKILQLRDQFIQLYPAKKHKKEYFSFVMHHWKHLLWPTDSAIASELNPTPWTYEPYCRFAKSAVLQNGEDTIRFQDICVEHHYPQHENIVTHYGKMFSDYVALMGTYLCNKLSAASGLEVRYPFIDPELVTFLDTIPLEIKFNPECPKQFQREIMAGILPDYILNANKRGFEPPFEFIWKMCGEYKYRHIKADYVFFNSMMADRMIDNLLK